MIGPIHEDKKSFFASAECAYVLKLINRGPDLIDYLLLLQKCSMWYLETLI